MILSSRRAQNELEDSALLTNPARAGFGVRGCLNICHTQLATERGSIDRSKRLIGSNVRSSGPCRS